MKRAIPLLIALLLAASASAETIKVAAAISLKDALAKVAEAYKTDTGENVELAVGSSGQLAAQILNGAPVDVFISAANKQVEDLLKQGAVLEEGRRVVAGNGLVLIVPADAKSPPESIKALAEAKVARIAMGEPKSVPAGQYAEQAINHAGIAEAVKEKLVLGTNVRQVLDYVERGEVSAGLVYATDAKLAGAKVRVVCTVDGGDHEPIVYPAALVKASTKQAAGRKFLDYLASEKGRKVMTEFGFIPPPTGATQASK